MSCSLHYRLALVAALVAVLALPNFLPAAEPTDQELLAGADARIEQCRKADATVAVVDAVGKPVAGAKIDVQQTRHAFLFGCNIFLWGKLPDKEPGAGLSAAVRGVTELRHAAVLLADVRTAARQSPACACGGSCPVVPVAGDHGQRASLGLEHRRSGLAARRCGRDPRLQMARIDDCVKRFRGQIDRWDVVNEVTAYDRDEFAKHTAPKYTAMWKKYGQIALHPRVLPPCPAGQPAGRAVDQRLPHRSGLRAGDRATGR